MVALGERQTHRLFNAKRCLSTKDLTCNRPSLKVSQEVASTLGGEAVEYSINRGAHRLAL